MNTQEQQGDLTVCHAREILQFPKFGDEKCLRALSLIRAASDLQSARDALGGPMEGLPSLSAMNREAIESEIEVFHELGWNGESFDD